MDTITIEITSYIYKHMQLPGEDKAMSEVLHHLIEMLHQIIFVYINTMNFYLLCP